MNNRVGKKLKMNNGQYATIIAYRECKDIDVKFEDGTIVEHRTYQNFILRTIKNPNYDAYADRVGKTLRMRNGQMATIVKYHNFENIEIEFEDGTIVKKKSYDAFLRHAIANPNYNPRIGLTNIMQDGQKAKIVDYRTARDMDVEFEDGRIIKMSWDSFNKGLVNTVKEIQQAKFGEQRRMKNGQLAKICAYRSYRDMDVEFEDGTVVEHVHGSQFYSNTIKNPNLPNTKWKDRTGLTKVMNCGLKATIKVYRSFKDVDIEFEDGMVVEHKDFASFDKGLVLHPIIGRTYKHNGEHLNEEKRMHNGHIAKIIRYLSTSDMDVLFDNGVIRKKVQMKSFRKGSIAIKNFVYKGFLVKDLIPDTDYYVVERDGKGFVLTYDEMDELAV